MMSVIQEFLLLAEAFENKRLTLLDTQIFISFKCKTKND